MRTVTRRSAGRQVGDGDWGGSLPSTSTSRSFDDQPDVMDSFQVAALLDMSTQEVTRGAREGWLPAYRVGQVWQFEWAEVLAWLRALPATPRGKANN